MLSNHKSLRPAAIIIGASSGIGYETASLLCARGWFVTNISRTLCELEKVTNVCADVSCSSDAFDAIASSAEKHGLSALVYSAGFSMAAPIEYACEKDYKYLFEVNFFGAIKAIKSALPYLKKRGGKIVLVGSLGGDIPIVFDSFYSCSKAALQTLAREANSELNPYGVYVTAVLPGGTATNFTFKRKVYSEEESRAYYKSQNRATAALANMEQSGMKADKVAECIYKVITSDKPPIVKTCGAKNAAVRYLSHVLPERATHILDDRAFKQ